MVRRGGSDGLLPPRIDGQRLLALDLHAHAERVREVVTADSRLVLVALDATHCLDASGFGEALRLEDLVDNVVQGLVDLTFTLSSLLARTSVRHLARGCSS